MTVVGRILVYAIAVSCLAILTLESTTAAPYRKEKHQKDLAELRKRIKGLSQSIEAERGKMDQFRHDLREVENNIGQVSLKLRIIEGNLKRQQKLLSSLYEREKSQSAVLADHQQLLSRQIRAAYAMGRQERIKVILNQEDPALLGRMLKYHDYLSEERAKRITTIKEILSRLEETRETIGAEETRLKALREKVVSRKSELEKVKEARKKVLAQLKKKITGNDKELARLKRDAKDLKKLIASLQDALADIPAQEVQQKPFKSLKRKLPWPTKGKIAAGFGSPRKTGVKWDGVYINAKEGQDVKAVHHGRVAYADWLRGFGLLLIIDHGNGYMSLYGHNQSLFKEVGEWVEAGEPIAQVGVSGGQSKSGIYFGIRKKGKALNPAAWCKPSKNRRIG